MKIFLIIFVILNTSSIFAKNISDCKRLVDDKERHACYDNVEKSNKSSDIIIIPSIEKIFKERKPRINANESFYGCIYFIEYGDEDLFTQKKELSHIRIGDSKGYATLYVDNFDNVFEGDENLPKIGDCFAFTTESGLAKLSEINYYGVAKIFSGEYKVDSIALKVELKNKITIDQYFEDDISYGSKRITLIGELEETFVANTNEFGISLVSKQGKTITAFYSPLEWQNNDAIKNKLRSIKMGDQIKLKGYFMMEMGFPIFTTLKILD